MEHPPRVTVKQTVLLSENVVTLGNLPPTAPSIIESCMQTLGLLPNFPGSHLPSSALLFLSPPSLCLPFSLTPSVLLVPNVWSFGSKSGHAR